MKTKDFERKLKLNQETVANLDEEKMDAIWGGVSVDGTCHTFCDVNIKFSICVCQ